MYNHFHYLSHMVVFDGCALSLVMIQEKI